MDGNPPGVDINHASQAELTGLPGLKSKIADRIIAGRPYQSVDDLKQLKGLPAGLIDNLHDLLTVSPVEPTPGEPILAESDGAPVAETPVETAVETSAETQEMISEGSPMAEPVLAESILLPEPSIEVSPVEPAVAEPVVTEQVVAEPEVQAPPDFAPAGESAAVQPVLEPGAAQPVAAPRPITTRRMIGCGALMGLATFLLAVAVTLLLLLAINGSLSFATFNQYAALNRQLDDLNSQVGGIQQDVTAAQARLSAMETLSGRVTSLETDDQSLRANLLTSQQQLDAAQTQLKQLNDRTTQIEQRSQAFSQFIEGLRSLISQIPTSQP
jgi:hypothetical protein